MPFSWLLMEVGEFEEELPALHLGSQLQTPNHICYAPSQCFLFMNLASARVLLQILTMSLLELKSSARPYPSTIYD